MWSTGSSECMCLSYHCIMETSSVWSPVFGASFHANSWLGECLIVPASYAAVGSQAMLAGPGSISHLALTSTPFCFLLSKLSGHCPPVLALARPQLKQGRQEANLLGFDGKKLKQFSWLLIYFFSIKKMMRWGNWRLDENREYFDLSPVETKLEWTKTKMENRIVGENGQAV